MMPAQRDCAWMRELTKPAGTHPITQTPYRVRVDDEAWTVATNGAALCAVRAEDAAFPLPDEQIEAWLRTACRFEPGPQTLDVAAFRAWLPEPVVECLCPTCALPHRRPWSGASVERVPRRLGGVVLNGLLAARFLDRVDAPTMALRIGNVKSGQPFQFHAPEWRVILMPLAAPADAPEYLVEPATDSATRG